MSDPATTSFQRFGRRLSLTATVVFGAVAALVVLVLVLAVFRAEALGPRRLWLLLLLGAPSLFYLAALWSLRSLFAGFARRGLAFDPAWAVQTARTGWGLLLGGVVTLATTPAVLAIVPSQVAGGFVTAGLPAVTLGVVGLALIALAALLRRGLALEAEKTALQATLEEFF